MKVIKLTPGKKCKCSCNIYTGNNQKTYWFDRRKKIVYSTDCHKKNPKQAIGKFDINGTIINQLGDSDLGDAAAASDPYSSGFKLLPDEMSF